MSSSSPSRTALVRTGFIASFFVIYCLTRVDNLTQLGILSVYVNTVWQQLNGSIFFSFSLRLRVFGLGFENALNCETSFSCGSGEKKKRRKISLSVLMLFGERRNENKTVSLMALNWVFRLSFGGRCRALLFEHVILLPATTGVLSRGLSKLIIAHFHFNGCWCRFVWVERFYCLREALFKLLLNDDGCWVDDEWARESGTCAVIVFENASLESGLWLFTGWFRCSGTTW